MVCVCDSAICRGDHTVGHCHRTGMVDAQARAAGPATALGPVDLYFVTQTSLGTPFQVDSGQLAEEKGGTKPFAPTRSSW